jgi:hypothetical protein
VLEPIQDADAAEPRQAQLVMEAPVGEVTHGAASAE